MSPLPPSQGESARFSRTWWARRLRGALWVAAISVLIWLYADLEFTKEREFRATVRLTAESSQLVLASEAEHAVTFTLRGPVSNLERFRRWLNEQAGGVLRYDVSGDFQPGDTGVPVERVLRAGARIDTFGLTYKAAAPSYLPLELERVIARELPVRLQSERMALPETKATATVLASQSRWAQIDARVEPGRARVQTEPIELDLFAPELAAGQTVTRRAKLLPRVVRAEDVPVRLKTPSVSYAFDVREIADVPVELVAVPAGILTDVEPARATVRLTGAQFEKLPAIRRLRTEPVSLASAGIGAPNANVLQAAVVPRIGELPVQVRPRVVEFAVEAKVERKTLTVRVKPLAPVSWAEDGTWDRYKLVPKTLGYLRERVAKRERWVGALQRPTIPLCLINGAADPVSGTHVPRIWKQLVPHGTLIELDPGIGHYPPLEAPDAVVDAYGAFLDTRRV